MKQIKIKLSENRVLTIKNETDSKEISKDLSNPDQKELKGSEILNILGFDWSNKLVNFEILTANNFKYSPDTHGKINTKIFFDEVVDIFNQIRNLLEKIIDEDSDSVAHK